MASADCLAWLKVAHMDITVAQDLYSKQQNPRHRPIEAILLPLDSSTAARGLNSAKRVYDFVQEKLS